MKNHTLSLIALLLVITPILAQNTQAPNINSQIAYNKWKLKHKRTFFSPEEQQFRQQVFFENLKRIEQHNSNPKSTYKMALNQFSDMTNQEFSNRILMRGAPQMFKNAPPKGDEQSNNSEKKSLRSSKAPSSMDWRDVMTEVKDQGGCGSCWAFSITGTLEAFHYLKHDEMTNLSEQQLVDCVGAKGYSSYGCDGGWPVEAMRYVSKFGLLKQEEYPYVGVDGACKVEEPTTNGFKVSSYQFLKKTPETLKDALTRLPVSVLVDASKWYNYSSGVFNDCGNTQEYNLNHAVIAVGYDEEGNWLIRNSWGTDWGMEGHMKLAPGNTCGILYSTLVATH